MKADITINMDNAAFEDNPSLELARILRRLSLTIESTHLTPGDSFPIHDINGNKVGYLTISETI